MTLATMTELNRQANRFHGILAGMSIDCEIWDKEIAELYNWLSHNEHLWGNEPFRSTVNMLSSCLNDGVITVGEKEEILQWCQLFAENNLLPKEVTTAIRQLHGVVHGIILDGKVTDDEILGLRDWLDDYEIFREHWPFCDFWIIIDHILADNKVTKK